jgi:lysophospholipase L1-like esterase
MNWIKPFFLFIFILFCFSRPCFSETIIKNSDFEQSLNSIPVDWDIKNDFSGNATTYSIESKKGINGSSCLTIKNNNPNNFALFQKIQVKPDTLYKFDYYIKVKNYAPSNGSAHVTFLYGVMENGILELDPFQNTNDTWEFRSTYFKTLKNHDELEICLWLGGVGSTFHGEASFDNFQLTEASGNDSSLSLMTFYVPGNPTSNETQVESKSLFAKFLQITNNENQISRVVERTFIICLVLSVLMIVLYSVFYKHLKGKLKTTLLVSGFLSFTVVLLLLLLEGFFALLLQFPALIPAPMRPGFHVYYQDHKKKYIQYMGDYSQYDAELFYLLKPGDFRYTNFEFNVGFSVNSKGVRDDEASLTNPEIIFLGDSITMGWGIKQDKTYAQIVESKLKMKSLNTGISSFGTVREMLLLKRLDVSRLKYLIIQFNGNDMPENIKYLKEKNLSISSKDEFQSGSDYWSQKDKYYFGQYFINIPGYIAKQTNFSLKKPPQNRGDKSGDATVFLDILHEFLSSYNQNFKVLVVDLCEVYHMDNNFILDLAEIIKQGKSNETSNDSPINNIYPVETAPFLTESDFFILDDHMNQKGHAKVAEILIKAIKAIESE